MKRVNYLYNNILSISNLEIAFCKAARGKRLQKEVQLFEQKLDLNLKKIQLQIKEGSFDFSQYSYFKIFDPKERIISVAPFKTRVVHHAIMNICHTTFENQQIYHSYATRINKGTHKAITQSVKNNLKYSWFLKLDIKKFFDSINHKVLKNMLLKKFKEPKLNTIFSLIIDSYNSEKGLPIGNLTSQYFANYYLSFLDRYAKKDLKIKGYVRYMDDIIIWGNSKSEVWFYYCQLKEFLKYNLKQCFKPPSFNKTLFSYNFLGYVLNYNSIRPNKRNRQKYIKKQIFLANELIKKNTSEEKALNQFWNMYSHQNFKINSYD